MTDTQTDSEESSDDSHFFTESLRTFPWFRAILAAIATFAVEFLAVAALFVVGPSSVDRTAAPINSIVDVLIQYGHLLFNAHHVPTVTRASVQIAGSPIGNDLYIATDAAVPPVVYFTIPIVALIGAGALFETYRSGTRGASVFEESALVGTGFTVGYLASGVVSAILFVQVWTQPGGDGSVITASQGPMLPAALVTFFLFPMVLVSLGAGAAYLGRDEPAEPGLLADEEQGPVDVPPEDQA